MHLIWTNEVSSFGKELNLGKRHKEWNSWAMQNFKSLFDDPTFMTLMLVFEALWGEKNKAFPAKFSFFTKTKSIN